MSVFLAARPREGVLPRLQPDGPGVGWEAEPGHLAGSLAVWTQGQGRIQKGQNIFKYFQIFIDTNFSKGVN